MAGKRIRDYFLRQIRALVDRSASEPEGFAAYFSEREPKDEEILGLIAVTTMLSAKYHLADRFPAPAEALASLPPEARMDICNEFRRQMRHCRRPPSLI
jgi:hypothetical protein